MYAWHKIHIMMEFRIFNLIFSDEFKIHRDSFNFDAYIEKVFERFLEDVVSIRLTDWLIICALVGFNWARALSQDSQSTCGDDKECKALEGMTVFVIAGKI